MLGMALVGTFVTNRYAAGVDTMMAAQGADAFKAWLEEPQILVDGAMAARFAAAVPAGLEPQTLLVAARGVFIDSVHHSQWLVLGVIALGFVVLHRMPPIRRNAGQQAREVTMDPTGDKA